jgi:hypothetical protein
LSGKGPTKSGQPYEWDDDQPTDVRTRSTLIGGLTGIPSVVDETEQAPSDRTDQYEALSLREPHVGSVLPIFLEARLEILSGPDAGTPFEFTMVRTVIGRGADADLRLHDSKMSKRHASITYTGSEFRIRDERSTNGTFLNGSKVVEYALRDGDKLLVGDTLLRFHLGGKK